MSGLTAEDEERFERWYPVAHRQVLAALVAWSGDLVAAGEATDEAFVRAYRRWSDVGRMTSPTGWAFVVARNMLRRVASRSAHERRLLSSSSQPLEAAVEDSADRLAAALEVARVLGELSPRQREVVVLHHGLDLSQEQVADLLGISRSTVATTLLDARRALGLVAPVAEKGGTHA